MPSRGRSPIRHYEETTSRSRSRSSSSTFRSQSRIGSNYYEHRHHGTHNKAHHNHHDGVKKSIGAVATISAFVLLARQALAKGSSHDDSKEREHRRSQSRSSSGSHSHSTSDHHHHHHHHHHANHHHHHDDHHDAHYDNHRRRSSVERVVSRSRSVQGHRVTFEEDAAARFRDTRRMSLNPRAMEEMREVRSSRIFERERPVVLPSPVLPYPETPYPSERFYNPRRASISTTYSIR